MSIKLFTIGKWGVLIALCFGSNILSKHFPQYSFNITWAAGVIAGMIICSTAPFGETHD